MRPHLLTIEAMGPYAGTESGGVDDLAAEGLFLIHGPTGSGRTFLFDALCFALYGEVPGARGDRGLVSHHTPAGATPRVSLEFAARAAATAWSVSRTTRPPRSAERAPRCATPPPAWCASTPATRPPSPPRPPRCGPR